MIADVCECSVKTKACCVHLQRFFHLGKMKLVMCNTERLLLCVVICFALLLYYNFRSSYRRILQDDTGKCSPKCECTCEK